MSTSLGDLIATIKVDDSTVDTALDETKAKLETVRQRAQALEAQFKAGAIGSDVLAQGLQDCAAESSKLIGQFHGLEAAAGRAASGSRFMNMMSIEAGRGFEDLVVTGGNVSSVINNANRMFEMYAYNAGLSAAATGGIGIAITLLGVGLNFLVNHWKDVVAAFKSGEIGAEAVQGTIEQLGKTIKELEDKDVKLFIDTSAIEAARAEIDRLKESHDALQRSMGKQTEEEQASGRAVEKALTGPEGRQAQADMVHRQQQAMEAGSQELAANQEKEANIRSALKHRIAEFGENSTTVKNVRAELDKVLSNQDAIRKNILSQANAAVGADVKAATGGVGREQQEARERLMRNAAGVGAKGVAAKLAEATPEAIEEDEAQQEANKEDQKESERRYKKSRAKEKHNAQVKARAAFQSDLKDAEEFFAEPGRLEKKSNTADNKVHNQQIKEFASAYAQKFNKDLLAAMGAHRRRNMTAKASDASLERQLITKMPEVPGELRGDTARKLVEQARLKFQADQAERGIAPIRDKKPSQRHRTVEDRTRQTIAERHAREQREAERRAIRQHKRHPKAPTPGSGSAAPDLPRVLPPLNAPPSLPPIVIPPLKIGAAGAAGGDAVAVAQMAADIREMLQMQKANMRPPNIRPINLIGGMA